MSSRWADEARCAADDPADWCDQSTVTARQFATCRSCPVLTACAQDALAMQATGNVVRAGVLCDRRTKAARERTEEQLIEVLTACGVTVEVVKA